MHPHDDDDDLTDLQSLPKDMSPPAALEDRTVDALRRRQLLAEPGRRVWLRAAAVLTLMGAAAAAGWIARGSASATHDHASRFVLLLYGDATGHASAGEAVAEYRGWARDLAGTGAVVSGERLANEAIVVGAPLEANLVRGYFIVQASDERRAVEIARTHPHVKRGGTIVVRRIAPT